MIVVLKLSVVRLAILSDIEIGNIKSVNAMIATSATPQRGIFALALRIPTAPGGGGMPPCYLEEAGETPTFTK